MVDTVLKLEDFAFSRFEIPSKINFGGEQRLAVHELVGGARVVDSMGRSDAPIEWSGLFFGEGALLRALYLDGLRIAGKTVTLEWSGFKYDVVVSSFRGDFERVYQIPYRITCTVVQDKVAPLTFLADPGVDQALRTDMLDATATGTGIGDSTLSSLLGTLDATIRTVSNFAKATKTTINSVLTPVAAVQARVNVLVGSVGNVLNQVTTLGGVIPNNPIAQSASGLLNQVAAMQQLPQLYQLNAVVGRMSDNLGTGTQTVTQAGGNLFAAAQKVYGDATAWTAIAKANSLADPQVNGVVTLNIPTAPNTSGGVFST
jgi:hypothetical protein